MWAVGGDFQDVKRIVRSTIHVLCGTSLPVSAPLLVGATPTYHFREFEIGSLNMVAGWQDGPIVVTSGFRSLAAMYTQNCVAVHVALVHFVSV